MFCRITNGKQGASYTPEAVAELHNQGYPIRASLAGGAFQKSYVEAMKTFCIDNNIDSIISFYKQLSRNQLARFFACTTLPFSSMKS